MKALHIILHGQVQGVFFRSETQKKARELGLMGWVRNNVDGSVEVHAEGEEAALKALEAWCQKGPPRARVEKIDVAGIEEEGHSTFEIL